LLIASRGVLEVPQPDGNSVFELTPESIARDEFTAEYYLAHKDEFANENGRIVTPTSFSPMNNYTRTPEIFECEGEQNGVLLQKLGVPSDCIVADHVAGSTLEEVLYTVTKQPFAIPVEQFTATRPLGVVCHDGQMERVLYFVRRATRLPASAILPLVVPGLDKATLGVSEKKMMSFTRAAMLGAHSPEAMLRREALGVAAMRFIKRGTYNTATQK
jgi:hypothetical protein